MYKMLSDPASPSIAIIDGGVIHDGKLKANLCGNSSFLNTSVLLGIEALVLALILFEDKSNFLIFFKLMKNL
jgi:hypothetical protein